MLNGLFASVYRRDAVVAAQNFTCVGCGTPIESSKYYQNWPKTPNKCSTCTAISTVIRL